MSKIEHPSLKYLRKEHANFEIVGRPALILNHMQRGLAGEGMFIPNWGPHAADGIKACGMVDNCRKLVDAFHEAGLPVIFCNAVPLFFCSFVCYVGKTAAVGERFIAY